MRIWHQSFTDLTVMPLYRKTLAELIWIVRKERDLIERKWHEHFS